MPMAGVRPARARIIASQVTQAHSIAPGSSGRSGWSCASQSGDGSGRETTSPDMAGLQTWTVVEDAVVRSTSNRAEGLYWAGVTVMERVDVVVVGAGALGSATAWWLARRGRSVALVEQFAQGHARGSSHGASRIFRYAYADPRYVRMVQAALPLWRELEDDVDTTLLEITGGLDHGVAALVAPVASAIAACGVEHERLTPDAAQERWPGMRFEGGVVHCPGAGRCLADATVLALQRRAIALGADVRFSTGPATLAWSDDRVAVRAADDEWTAPAAVVTAGAWLPSVVASQLPP